MADEGSERIRSWSSLLALAVLLATAFQLGRTYRFAETDLWWNLASGRTILETGSIPRQDLFAYTPTLPVWHNHEWLTQILWILTWWEWGPEGLILLKSLLVTLVFALSAWAALRRGASSLAVSFFCLLTAVGFYPVTSIRPQIASYVMFAGFLLLLGDKGRIGIWRWAIGIALIPLWVGLHGGFVVGLTLLGALVVGRILDRGWKREKPLALFYGACLLATLINPYGWDLHAYMIESIPHDRSMFWEWAPILRVWKNQWAYFLTLGVTIASLGVSRRKLTWEEIGVLGASALVGFLRARLAAFFMVAAWVYVPVHFANALARVRVRASVRRFATVSAFAAVLYGLTSVLYAVDHEAFKWDWRLKIAGRTDFHHVGFPVDAVAWMKDHNIAGKVACPLNWGGFLGWELHPLVKVSIDGRWDTVFSQELIKENWDFERGIHWQEFLKKYPPDYVMAYRGEPLDQALSVSKRWKEVFRGVEGVVFARSKWEIRTGPDFVK